MNGFAPVRFVDPADLECYDTRMLPAYIIQNLIERELGRDREHREELTVEISPGEASNVSDQQEGERRPERGVVVLDFTI